MLDLLGKEYVEKGRGPNHFDCYGLCIEVLKRKGLVLPDIESETDANLIHKQIVENSASSIFKRLHKPQAFCLVTFIVQPPYVSHVGVVLEDCKRFIHIMEKRQVTIERLDSVAWSRRIKGYYAINKDK